MRTLWSIIAVFALVGVAGAQDILINEVDADTEGTDMLEFAELYGPPNAPLDGLVLVFYNGNGAVSYAAYDLDGYTLDDNGFFLLGNADVVPTPEIIIPSNGIQNGADAIALFVGDGEDFPVGSGIPITLPLDAIVYDTNDPDDPILLTLLLPGEPQLNEDELGQKDFHSNLRCPDGGGGPRVTSEHIQGLPTPGSSNEPTCNAGPPLPNVLINELDADTEGIDALEFIELYGDADLALDGIVLVLFNGNGDLSYVAYDLDGYALDSNGFFLIGNSSVTPTPAIIIPDNGIQNGADAAALYLGDGDEWPVGTPISTDNLIDAIVYDTNDDDDPELLTLLLPGEPQLNEDENGNKDFHSNLRCPDGGGGPRVTTEHMQGLPTPGSTNEPTCSGGPPVPVEMSLCEAVALDPDGYPINMGTLVHITSPLIILNNDGTFAVGRLDHAMTDGECCGYLFDFDAYLVLNEGDEIDLIGTVDFYNGKVEIAGPDMVVTILSTGNPLPDPELITTEELMVNGNDYESCLIMIDNLTIVGGDPWPPEGQNANIEVADETLVTAVMRIDLDTNIDGTDPEPEPFTCIGIGGQYDYTSPYDEGFQILPRKRIDIFADPIRAVCCVGADCFIMTQEECEEAGGVWHEEWDTCEPNPCGTPTQTTSWGKIKTMYR